MSRTRVIRKCLISVLVPYIFLSLVQLSFAAQTEYEVECRRLATQTGRDSERLQQFFNLDWKHSMIESPESATYVGFPGQNHRWSDVSLEAIARRKRELNSADLVLRSINRAALTVDDQLSYDLFRYDLNLALEARDFPSEYLPLNQLEGVHIDTPKILMMMPADSVKDFEDRLSRLRGLPILVEQTIGLLSQGITTGFTLPRITLRDIPEQIKKHLNTDLQENAFYVSFKSLPASIAKGEQERLQKEAAEVITNQVIPAFQKLYNFVKNTYIPAAREDIAWSSLPEGRKWYSFKSEKETTTRQTPEEIHQIGLEEVSRIRRDMEEIISKQGFKSFEDYTKDLRENPKFYFESAQDLLREYRNLAKRVDPELTRLFGKLPRLPYGITAIPEYAEKSAPAAYYEPGSPDAFRAGFFQANTYDLKSRPKWEMESLTLHEAVPGHHFQIALSQEMTGVPDFRRFGGYTAYVEGWALYAETLGEDLGLYTDPNQKFGQLINEIWRAIRLVLDTGMHVLGWSREQAIRYFLENTGRSEHDITVEVDRYIVWPGQALAYKMGQLKIKALRARAVASLGPAFDIREFHDLVLGSGALPLDVLEAKVNQWIAKKKPRKRFW